MLHDVPSNNTDDNGATCEHLLLKKSNIYTKYWINYVYESLSLIDLHKSVTLYNNVVLSASNFWLLPVMLFYSRM